VSSTLQELAPERAAARAAIESLQLIPVLFELGARPHPPQALYRAYLEQSQLFVGLYWQSYGWTAPGESVSGIEDEYRMSSGLPRLLYVKEPAAEREQRLSDLLGRIESQGMVSYRRFEAVEELRGLLTQDLAILLTERFELAVAPAAVAPSAQALPSPRTSFVGRTSELGRIDELLGAGTRLLTLTGPGGIGKTRLAVEAAQRLRNQFGDGVAFVPLDGVDDAELVPSAVHQALGVRDLTGDTVAALEEYLRGKELLLVLDNFEHVVSAAPVVARLLEVASGLTVLVTSRELLRLSGERELAVPPISAEDEAVALFTERAAAARHAFELSDEDVALVAEICRRLDGVPLAIELAAPRMRLLTPAQLLERLSKRLVLEGPRDAPARQRTLEAAIAWSYELLTAGERRVFERLAVFHGSFTLEAAEAVAGAGTDLVDSLASLLDKSIVYRLPELGETRFAMLRMIREYALERLADAGDADETLERLAGYYLQLAQQAGEGLRSAAQRQWKRTLDLEADNIRAVLGWAVERQRIRELGALMNGIMLWFMLQSNLDEGRTWLGHGLAAGSTVDAVVRGQLLANDVALAVLEGELEEAAVALPEAQALLAGSGEARTLAELTLMLSFPAAAIEGEKRAYAQARESLAGFEALDDLWGMSISLSVMCRLRTIFDDYVDEGDLFERALAAAERVGDDLGIGLQLVNMANRSLATGEYEAARNFVGRSLEQMRTGRIVYSNEEALEILAKLERVEGRDEHAVELLAAADRFRHERHIPLLRPAHERRERLLDELRSNLGDDVFEAACRRGRKLDDATLQETAFQLAGVGLVSLE